MGLISNIFQSIKKRFASPDYQKLRDEAAKNKQPLYKQQGFQYSNQNAQSWNPETHPDGRGDSYLVETIDYDEKTGYLDVQYRDGFKARYRDIDPELVKQFNSADSKGRFAKQYLFDLPYEEV